MNKFCDTVYSAIMGASDPQVVALGSLTCRRFLALIQTLPDSESFFVPTLDIDLAWQYVFSPEVTCAG